MEASAQVLAREILENLAEYRNEVRALFASFDARLTSLEGHVREIKEIAADLSLMVVTAIGRGEERRGAARAVLEP